MSFPSWHLIGEGCEFFAYFWLAFFVFLIVLLAIWHIGAEVIDVILAGRDRRAEEAAAAEQVSEALEREHAIARHHRERPSLAVVQERRAVTNLNAYRDRRTEVSPVRRPGGGDTAA